MKSRYQLNPIKTRIASKNLLCGLVLIISVFTFQAKAQKTNIKVTITASTLDGSSGGNAMDGWNYSVNYVDIYAKNGKDSVYMGSVTIKNTTQSYTLNYTPLLLVPDEKITIALRYKYRYYDWPEHSPEEKIVYSTRTVTLKPDGTADETYHSLTDPHQDSRFVKYKVEITPYQPSIVDDETKKCFNDTFKLHLNSKTPSTYTSICTYYWQYGTDVPDTIENSQFVTSFLYQIGDDMLSAASDCQSDCPTDVTSVYNAIVYNTDYKFMADEYILSMYDDYSTYKSSIGYAMLNGIYKQNYNDLTYDDQNFLYANFMTVFNRYTTSPVPYTMGTKVDWKKLEDNLSSTEVIVDPSKIAGELTDRTKVYFRVLAKSGSKSGSYSDSKTQDVLPAPPKAGLITPVSSCPNSNPTGSIILTNISSPAYTDRYTYRVAELSSRDYVNPDDKTGWPGTPKFFSGSSYTITGLKPGKQKLYLSYEDPNIANCLVAQTFVIDSLDALSFTPSHDDVTCPENSDGKIHFTNITGVSPYKYYLDGVDVPSADILGKPKGTYSVSMTDGCVINTSVVKKNVTISAPEAITASLASLPNNPTCFSPANGGFDLNVTGGTNGKYNYYVYSNVNGSPSGSPLASGIGESGSWHTYSLPGGDYIISVKDNANSQCFGDTLKRTLVPATHLGLSSPVVTDVKCFGEKTGSISATTYGGSGSYKYSLEDSSKLLPSGNKFENLYAGTYYVIAHNTDVACLDTARKKAIISSNPEIDITLTPQDVSCFNEGDGQIEASVKGGSNNYSLEWQENEGGNWGLSFSNNYIVNKLDPGRYRIKVTDNVGCAPLYKETVINQPQTLAFQNVLPHDIRCFGELGSIAMQATGGNGTYSYWYRRNNSDPVAYEQPGTNVLSAGDYKLEVTDIKGCNAIWPETVTLTSPPAVLDFTTSLSDYNGYNVSCAGSSNGSITVNPSGGNGPGYDGYTYLLEGYSSQETPVFSNLPSGTRNLTVTDGRGCQTVKPVTLEPPTSVNLSVGMVEDIPCYGLSTGKITVNGSGGVEPYSYKIGTGTLQTDNEFANLLAGKYSLTVQDKNGCEQVSEATVKHIYNQIHINLTPTDVRCFGEDNGWIDALITGGSGSFDLLWEQKINENWQTKQTGLLTISPLQPGNYRLKVIDKVGCPALFDSTWVYQPQSAIEISSASLNDIRCYGEQGSIDLLAEGGNGNYQYFYSKNSGAKQSYIPGSPLDKGIYQLSAKDYKGCEASWPNDITITEPASALNYNYTLSNYSGFNVSCFGSSNGRIAVKATGGNGAQYTGYSYLLSTRTVQSDSVFAGLTAQGYQLTVRDARGCEVTRSLSLTQPLQSLQLSVSDLKDTKCFNDSTGQITLAASGGVQPFTYRIGQESFVSSNIYPKLPVGKYNFTAKDVNGCTIVIDTVVRHILPTPSIALVPQEISCYGHEDGQVSASLSGGSGSFAYRWYRRNNGSWNDLTNTSSLISQLAPGDYRLQATDKAGCPSIYDSTTIYQLVTPLVIDKVTLHDIRCFGENGSIDIQASGSNGGYIYQYSKNDGVFQNYNSGNPLPYARYNLRVVDAKGCTTDWPYVQTITTPLQPLGLTYTLKDYNGYNVSCFGNDDGRLAVKPTGGNGSNYSGYTYALSGRTVQTDTVFDKLTAGNYNLTLTDARGCSFLQPVTLTQALSEVKLWASLIDPATCHYDSNGKITLAALGGKSPYTFRLENGSYQEANQFSGLKVGSYHLTVRDKNGCQQFMDTTVDYAIPKIEITGTISPVKCFGQDNGAITTGVSGGALPYAYYWKENARTSSDIDKLFKGSYTLSVTDAAGCIEEKEFQVKEPALPLSVTATSLSACAETQNGVVRPVALGGTPPYFYSVESFSKTTTGKEILVYDGTYTVFATDSNHCEASTKVIVQKRNDMPLPNFMVATSRYSLDTLVIKDVSVPKPDSITWEFSPEAKIIGYEQFEPKIKYEGAGAYSVKMIGHFGSCDYSVDKLISIAPFDPTIKERDNYQRGVQSIELSPNPNNGQFKVKIALYNKEQVQLKVLDIWGKQWHSASFPACLDIETDIRLDNPISGTYVLWVVTDTDAKAIRFVISR